MVQQWIYKMETTKDFFENLDAQNEKELASIIKESISDRSFRGL